MYAYMGIYRKHINQNSLQIKKILKKGKTKKKRKKKNLLKAWPADFGLSAHIFLCKVNYEYVV